MVFSEHATQGVAMNDLCSVNVNPKNGKTKGSATMLTSSEPFQHYGLGLSMDGLKIVYSKRVVPGADREGVFLRKYRSNGSLAPVERVIASAPGVYNSLPFITEDGKSVYYSTRVGADMAVILQRVKSNGAASGAPITALQVAGESANKPMLDGTRGWMSFLVYPDLYIVRVGADGIATGAPIKVVTGSGAKSMGVPSYILGGITRNARVLVYVRIDSTAHTYNLYSQKLGTNGQPAGGPTLLDSSWPYYQYPWNKPD